MKTPKLVVVDLDGTVVPHSTARVEPSPEVVKALAAVRAAGVPVVIATGRALWSALPTALHLGLTDGMLSAAHGAITYDLATERVTDSRLIDPGPAVDRMRSLDPSVAFGVELDTRGWRHTDNFPRDFATTWADIVDLPTLAATRTTRLAVRLPGVEHGGAGRRCPFALELAAAADLDRSQYGQEIGFNGWIDIGPPGVTKATGLDGIAAGLGVDAADAVVFGDAHNDLPMFEWAGHAIAMGQAGEDVKAAADEVAPTVDEDGVAAVLRRWFA